MGSRWKPALGSLLSCVIVLAACGGGQDETSAPQGAEQQAEAEPPLPKIESIKKAGAEELQAPADWLAAGAGSVWGSWKTEIRRLDGDTGRVADEIDVPPAPCQGMDFGFGALWTTTCSENGLAKIDPRSLEVTHVRLDVPDLYNGSGMIGAGEGAVWLVLDGEGCEACVLAGVDPSSMEVEHEIEIEPGAASVRTGHGFVWVTNPEQNVVFKVDPGTDEVAGETQVGESPQYLTVDATGVWVFNQLTGSVSRLDPKTAEVTATIEADMAGAGGSITSGEGSIWVRGPLTLLAEIDSETNEVVARYGPESSGGGDVVAAYGALWTSRYEEKFEDILRLPLR